MKCKIKMTGIALIVSIVLSIYAQIATGSQSEYNKWGPFTLIHTVGACLLSGVSGYFLLFFINAFRSMCGEQSLFQKPEASVSIKQKRHAYMYYMDTYWLTELIANVSLFSKNCNEQIPHACIYTSTQTELMMAYPGNIIRISMVWVNMLFPFNILSGQTPHIITYLLQLIP